ncbi:plastocyanin/azurin family copper-binding protein [Nitrosopumilus adriaticus]|uniref:cupredoxin domain-containing protein n=1 Tax=Nitrosopumilus adriaticus TaxID=1580092 RepID=UPI00352E5B48
MTREIILVITGLFMIFPMISFSAYADNSWIISINQYDELEKSEIFQPREIPIFSGDKVTWQNNDSDTHKIVSGVPQHPDYSGEYFSSELISPGGNYSITLDFNGFAGYYYFCEIHPWYTGKIFFEDRPDIYYSTLDISYKIHNEQLFVEGSVESDLGNSEYGILVYDSKNNLVTQKLSSFEGDASFSTAIDISDPIWDEDEKYMAKLVYGVPSESTSLAINIPIKHTSDKSNYSEFCQESKSDSSFVYNEINLPSWYKNTLCWYETELITEKEYYDSLDFLKKALK